MDLESILKRVVEKSNPKFTNVHDVVLNDIEADASTFRCSCSGIDVDVNIEISFRRDPISGSERKSMERVYMISTGDCLGYGDDIHELIDDVIAATIELSKEN